jgi:DNA-binding beta-propeller fold protein YncE
MAESAAAQGVGRSRPWRRDMRRWRLRTLWAAAALAASVGLGPVATAAPPVTLPTPLLLGSWVPVPALDAALRAAGWGAVWEAPARRWALTTPPGVPWQPPARAAAPAAAGAFTVVVDGTAVGSLPPMAMVDPVTGASVPYFTLAAVASLLAGVGLPSSWMPATWHLGAAASAGAPAGAIPAPTQDTLVGVPGEAGTVTSALVAQAVTAPRGTLTAAAAGVPLGVSVGPAQAAGPAATPTSPRRWLLPFTLHLSASLAPGQFPLTLTWVSGSLRRTYHALLVLPALLLAEQDGVYADNLMGQPLHLPGAFAANHGAGGVVFDPLNQRIYASDPVHNRIDVFNTRGQLVQTLDPLGLHDPTFLALDASGNRLFVDDNGARIVELSLSGSGQIIPFAHTPFHAIFSLGDGMAFDAANGNLYVSRSLTSNQAARGASPVVVYSTRTGRRVIPAASFPGIGSFATGIAYDPANGDLYVGGEQTTGSSPTAYVASYTPQGQRLSGAGAFPEGPVNGEHAYGICVDPLNGEILVLGDTRLHAFTPQGAAVPPVTSQTTSSGTPMGDTSISGVIGIALVY